MTTLIDGGTVVAYHHGGHAILENGQVAYDNERIVHVGRGYTGPVEQRMDARGKLVIPGLINHHLAFGVHMQLFRLDFARPNYFNSGLGLGVQPRQAYVGGGPGPDDWRASAAYAMTTALRTGSTTFVMVPNYGRHPYRGRVGSDDELIELVEASGMRAYLSLPFASGGAQGRSDGTVEWVLDQAAGYQGLEQAVAFARSYDGAAGGRIRTFLFPYLADACTPELLHDAKAAAAELGVTLKIHVSQYLLEFFELLRRTGVTPIRYLAEAGFLGPEVSLAHAIFTPRHPWLPYPPGDDSDTRLIADSGASVAHCPVVFARSGVALHSFSHYVRAGIPVSLGTDTSPHDMLMEMRTAALMSKLADGDATSGLAREVFDAATLGGARALGRPDLGRLEAGACADIVVLDLERTHIAPVAADDPIKALVYCARGADVETVIVGGIVRVENGVVLDVDGAAQREGAERFNRRLRASAGSATYRDRSLLELYGSAFPEWQA